MSFFTPSPACWYNSIGWPVGPACLFLGAYFSIVLNFSYVGGFKISSALYLFVGSLSIPNAILRISGISSLSLSLWMRLPCLSFNVKYLYFVDISLCHSSDILAASFATVLLSVWRPPFTMAAIGYVTIFGFGFILLSMCLNSLFL